MRDITRGGLATVLNEVCNNTIWGIGIEESIIPVRPEVKGFCEIFGYDPLYLANEGKIVVIVKNEEAKSALELMKSLPYGGDAEIIGEITSNNPEKVILETEIGSHRILDMLSGEMLPRIC